MSTGIDLKVWGKRRCGNCALWGKPPEKRALADHFYPCKAPEPDLSGFNLAACFYLAVRRDYVTRDDGKTCPRWEPKQ